MEQIKIYISNRNSDAHAEAIYEDGKVTVLPGGIISADFANHIQGGDKAKMFRNSTEYVDKNRIIIKECVFQSPSTAAQFVTGQSRNGYEGWKVQPKVTLGKYLKSKGLR